MPEPSTAAFEAEVARALRSLEADSSVPALDPLGDPAGAARALSAEGGGAPLILRVAPELGGLRREQDTGFGPAPRDPVWLRIERGASLLRLAPLRLAGARHERPEAGGAEAGAGGAGEGTAEARDAVGVQVISERRPCCGAPTCARERTYVAAWLALAAPGPARATAARRLLVAEAQDLEAARAEALVEAVAAPLAAALGVPLETARGTEPPGAIAPRPLPEPAPTPLPAAALSRFAIRSEGEILVLRDHASHGPRGSAARNALIGAALLLAALALWIQVMRSASAGDSGIAIGVGSAAALLSLAGYAFLGVARFSSRYAARSAPVVSFGPGRFVVAPWVSRTGAIDLRPEGRLGAAISAGEVRDIRVLSRGDRFAIEIETDHGPIDALLTEREDVARYWRDAMDRAVASVRHSGGPSAKQRLRARAQAQQAPAAG